MLGLFLLWGALGAIVGVIIGVTRCQSKSWPSDGNKTRHLVLCAAAGAVIGVATFVLFALLYYELNFQVL
jgi:hypothetical protein